MITFLENEASFNGVDPEFRKLVMLFHQIPYCATFGVSCAGHCERIGADRFWPVLYGRLNIIVLPGASHIDALLEALQKEITRHADTSFCEKKHVFGPPESSRLRIWEVRINDNHCLDVLRPDYCFQYLKMAEYGALYAKAIKRYEEIKLFWAALEKIVSDFCQQFNCKEVALEKRIEEIMAEWEPQAVSVSNKKG